MRHATTKADREQILKEQSKLRQKAHRARGKERFRNTLIATTLNADRAWFNLFERHNIPEGIIETGEMREAVRLTALAGQDYVPSSLRQLRGSDATLSEAVNTQGYNEDEEDETNTSTTL